MTTPNQFRTNYIGVRTIVCGASGFIGRRFVQALSRSGARVYAVVRSKTAADLVVSACPSACEAVECDLRNESCVRAVFAKVRPSITFNLAGYGVDPAERDGETAYALNAIVPQILADALYAYADASWYGQQLIHAGSALEYGQAGGNLAEDCVPRPTTLYGRSKLEGTLNVAAVARRTGLRAVTARLFMVYGPGERPYRLLPSLLRIARTGETLDLTDGVQRRDFTYVDDVVEGLLRLGVSAAKPGETVNLATGKLASVREFSDTAAQIMQIPVRQLCFGALPARKEEMYHEQVNVKRLYQLCSWLPTTTPAQGILWTAELARRAERKVNENIPC